MEDRERERIIRQVRAKARKRVRQRVGFMWHLVVFLLAQVALYQINATYSPDTTWFVWPLGAWGAALLLHAFATFQGGGMTEETVEAEVRRELERRSLS